jgi:hypothetical protein
LVALLHRVGPVGVGEVHVTLGLLHDPLDAEPPLADDVRVVGVADVHLHGDAIAPRVQNGHDPVLGGLDVLLPPGYPHVRILLRFSPQFEFVGPSNVSVSVFHNLRKENVRRYKRIIVPLNARISFATSRDWLCNSPLSICSNFFLSTLNRS